MAKFGKSVTQRSLLALCLTTLMSQGPVPAGPAALTDDQAYTILREKLQREIDPEWWHLSRFEQFPGVILVSSFAYDRGNRPEGVLVDHKYGNLEVMTPSVLAAGGWSRDKHRPALADRWVRDALLVPASVLETADKEFAAGNKGTHKFSAPSSVLNVDGSVTVEVWTRLADGRVSRRTYAHRRYIFSPTGQMSLAQVLEDFTVTR